MTLISGLATSASLITDRMACPMAKLLLLSGLDHGLQGRPKGNITVFADANWRSG